MNANPPARSVTQKAGQGGASHIAQVKDDEVSPARSIDGLNDRRATESQFLVAHVARNCSLKGRKCASLRVERLPFADCMNKETRGKCHLRFAALLLKTAKIIFCHV